MNILVTGGAGFIGSHVVDALLAAGHAVVVLDDLSHGSRDNVNPRAELVVGSVTESLAADLINTRKPDAVVHLAAQIDVRRSVADPVGDAQVNVLGTVNLLQAAVDAGVRRFVFFSSGGAVYDESVPRPTPEAALLGPVSPYGVSKLSAEHFVDAYRRRHGLATVVLRPANVYGPRQDAEGEGGVVAVFCRTLLNGRAPVIYGDGEQTRDFVYVGDVAAACGAALAHDAPGPFNVATGIETSINSLAEQLQAIAGTKVAIAHAPAKAGEGRASCLSSAKALRELGWQPSVALEGGLRKTILYFKQALQRSSRVQGKSKNEK